MYFYFIGSFINFFFLKLNTVTVFSILVFHIFSILTNLS